MHSDPSATYSGKEMGAGVVNGSLNEHAFPARGTSPSLPTIPKQDTSLERRERISRENPLGVTTIIGGTNVRICLSIPGNPEPLVHIIKWQTLHDEYAASHPEHAALPPSSTNHFRNALEWGYQRMAKECISFIASHFDLDEGPPPFDKICAFNYSVAGRVEGDDEFARIFTSNTGIRFDGEQIAIKMGEGVERQLQEKRWPIVPQTSIVVMNDAMAGLRGEMLGVDGGLTLAKTGKFYIFGTGVGSMTWHIDKPLLEFDEAGHRGLYNTETEQYRILVGEQIKEIMDAEGGFKLDNPNEVFAEHKLAGPWVAIQFVKEVAPKPKVMNALARRIVISIIEERKDKKDQLQERVDPEELYKEVLVGLEDLSTMKPRERYLWAINANGHMVKAVNKILLNPDPLAFFGSDPCDNDFEAQIANSPEDALVVAAGKACKRYFKDIGLFLGADYRAMETEGVAPDKMILGGGIGELFNRYPAGLRELALKMIHKAAQLPRGTIDFSRMSPEARECTPTYLTVEASHQDHKAISSLAIN
jgi:hypothetical protein